MKRFFTKIVRFFWSWGFLKFILAVIVLIVLVYVEEDWRGARAWAATKAKWEAKGESFDLNKFIPPPVPDDQNLAALPLFKLEPDPQTHGALEPLALKRAMRSDLPGQEFSAKGNWQKGELTDMAKIRTAIASDYEAAFKGVKPPEDTLAQFNAIYPFFTDFLAAAATHPFFRLNIDYAVSPPAARSLGPITTPIKLAQILTLHAILALDHHQSDLALQDIKTNYTLISGVKRDPSLVGGLVAIGVAAIDHGAIYDGLAQHEWGDAQLIEIDHTLRPINFLADYQFAMRCEIAQSTANLEFFQHMRRSDLGRIFGASVSDSPLTKLFDVPWPSGWWDINKSQMAAFLFHKLATVDPQAHLVFPKANLNLQQQVEQARASWAVFAPWNILFLVAAPPLGNAMQKYAQAQVWVDEARIACALERYRLAQGVYPGALDALAPTYIDEVPHDIMNGQSYHYQLRDDGTYLLYSVGWNQTDEGGKIAFKEGYAVKVIDYEKGDWVWPTPQAANAK